MAPNHTHWTPLYTFSVPIPLPPQALLKDQTYNFASILPLCKWNHFLRGFLWVTQPGVYLVKDSWGLHKPRFLAGSWDRVCITV